MQTPNGNGYANTDGHRLTYCAERGINQKRPRNVLATHRPTYSTLALQNQIAREVNRNHPHALAGVCTHSLHGNNLEPSQNLSIKLSEKPVEHHAHTGFVFEDNSQMLNY